MLTEERYQIILDRLSQNGSVTVAELSERLVASESTVRRDLNALDALGKLTKVHGGATIRKGECPAQTEPVCNALQNAIAKCAAEHLVPGDFVFLDASSLTLAMIEHIKTIDMTVVTCGLRHAGKLAQNGIRILLPGGQVSADGTAVTGAQTIADLSRYHFTKCYLAADGINLSGCTVRDPEQCQLLQTVLSCSTERYILADHEKFDQTAPVCFAGLEQVRVITDHLYRQDYKELGCIWEVIP